MKNIVLISGLFLASQAAFSQVDIGNEEITITKEREVNLPKANRIFEKIPMVEAEKTSKKITYKFYDRKPSGVEKTNFSPTIIEPVAKVKNPEDAEGYYNYLKLGGGNFGRTFGELHLNSLQDQKFTYGLYLQHNAARRGPVLSDISGNNTNQVKIDGKYHSEIFEVKAHAGYERKNFFFYGYDTTFLTMAKDDIRQRLHLFDAGISLENIRQNAKVDYQLGTNLKTVNDYYGADETEWLSTFNAYFPLITDRLVASLKSDASISQRTDNTFEINGLNKRNLFRVEPSFTFSYNRIGVMLGYRAVNQYDQINQINKTSGFPIAEITYKTPSLFYVSVGYDGDIIRNTLRGFLNENRFLRNQVPLLSTEKSKEIYVSSKGAFFSGISYNAKLSYGTFKDLYLFTTYEGDPQTRRFDVVYENQSIPYFHTNLQVNYQPSTLIRSNLNINYYKYQVKSFEKAFHRPEIDVKLTNQFIISDKLVAAVDLFVLGNNFAKDPFTNEVKKLPTIMDLNTEFNYLFGKQFAAFVQINNLIGKNYQRFLNYPQQGTNFLVGVNISI